MRNHQSEYSAILDALQARARGLSQGDCERILKGRGYSSGQAKNGAYVYLYHGMNLVSKRRGSTEEYAEILDEFKAEEKKPKESIAHLESKGFSYRQSQTAVYNYRKERGLIGK